LKSHVFWHLLFCTNEFSNYRILTPSLPAFPVPHGDFSSRFQLPVFDASKTEDRIQKTGNRMGSKRRRQKPVVDFTGVAAKTEASKPGSW
jgi:hypothetical protein